LGIWESLYNGDDLDLIRNELDEETLVDFDSIRDGLLLQALVKLNAAQTYCILNLTLDRKDFALMVQNTVPKEFQALCFMLYDNKSESQIKKAIFKQLRPTNNILPGYTPSTAMNRFQQEAI
jgi:RNA ligase